jgi:hypothetical protein
MTINYLFLSNSNFVISNERICITTKEDSLKAIFLQWFDVMHVDAYLPKSEYAFTFPFIYYGTDGELNVLQLHHSFPYSYSLDAETETMEVELIFDDLRVVCNNDEKRQFLSLIRKDRITNLMSGI